MSPVYSYSDVFTAPKLTGLEGLRILHGGKPRELESHERLVEGAAAFANAYQRGIAPEEEMDTKPRPMRPETGGVRRLFDLCVTTPERQR